MKLIVEISGDYSEEDEAHKTAILNLNANYLEIKIIFKNKKWD